MYNTRRGGGPQNAQKGGPTTPASAVGQRRPVVTHNFVPGGQLNQGQQQYNQQQAQQNYAQQQQQQRQQQGQVGPRPPVQQQQAVPQKQEEPKIIFKNEQQQQNQQQAPANNGGIEGAEGSQKPRPHWQKSNAGKVSKKERLRRRNKRLGRMLQPKNAVMVLNEMVSGVTYVLNEADNFDPYRSDLKVYKASVLVDGLEHFGTGRSKNIAKAAAAEAALKYLVVKKLKTTGQTTENVVQKVDNGEDIKMDEEDTTLLPWQHVASFALHKLFSNWDDSGAITERLIQGHSTVDGGVAVPYEKKPAKKLPENPEKMNPVMLLNQMAPHAKYEEIKRDGMPPHVTFTYTCAINGEIFYGSGPNKKTAKKICAFEACRKLFNINYPPELYVPNAPQPQPMQVG